ncbi:hypothetical protein B0H10DRAFT_1980686 [Mycena sp. CBHHK59/15]|nr:hypothetical protein B0H10DRAFT_1980686 [Mycena sp. CBHHK59/15]
MSLWAELQPCSYDAASQPNIDLISYANAAFFFGVVTVKKTPDSTVDQGPVVTEGIDIDAQHESQSAAASAKWGRLSKTKMGPLFPLDVKERSANKSPEDPILEDLVGFNKTPISEWPVSERPASDEADVWNWGAQVSSWDWDSDSSVSDPFTTNGIIPSDIPPFMSQLPGTYPQPHSPDWSAPISLPSAQINTEIRDQIVESIEDWRDKRVIGLIYLTPTPFALSPSDQIAELNLGIIIKAEHRAKGYAREAIRLVVKHAMEVKHCHRIQASLIQSPSKDRIMSLLTQMRFGHEGTKRRSFFNPLAAEWQDVTTLAILDTDWAFRTFYKSAPKSLWDEMFLRHARERDELLRWEDTQNRLKRTSSMETIRAVPADTDSNDSDTASTSSGVSSSSSSENKGKKRLLSSDQQAYRDAYHDEGSGSDADSDIAAVLFKRRRAPKAGSPLLRAFSPALSDSSVESVPHSVLSTAGYAHSASGSEWDMLESSSSSDAGSFSDNELE